MGLKSAFGKIGRGIWTGVRQVDRVGDLLNAVPGGKNLLLAVPIAGPYLKIALEEVDWAERTFSAPGSGREKLEAAVERVKSRLEAEGVHERHVRALIEVALLVLKDDVDLFELTEGGQ